MSCTRSSPLYRKAARNPNSLGSSSLLVLSLVVAIAALASLAVGQTTTAPTTSGPAGAPELKPIEWHLGTRLMNCYEHATSLDDCNKQGYTERIIVIMMGGLAIGGFSLLCCPVYFISKYICNCCGGRNQSPNFCCPVEGDVVYQKGDIYRTKFAFGLALLVCLGGAAIGMIMGREVITGVKDFLNAVNDIPDQFEERWTTLAQALAAVPVPDANGNAGLLNIIATPSGTKLQENADAIANVLSSQVTDAVDSVKVLLPVIDIGVMVCLLAVPILVLLSTLCCACNVRNCLTMFMVALLFLFVGGTWLIHGFFTGVDFLFNDLCVEIEGAAQKRENLFQALAECKEPTFDGFRSAFIDIEMERVTATCDAIKNGKQICYDSSLTLQQNIIAGTLYQCPSSVKGVACPSTFTELLDVVQFQVYIHPDIEANRALYGGQLAANICPTAVGTACTLKQCAAECPDGEMKIKSKRIDGLIAAAQVVSDASDQYGSQWTSCRAIYSWIATSLVPGCNSIGVGVANAKLSTGIIGLGGLLALIAVAWGRKRFLPLSEANRVAGEAERKYEETKRKNLTFDVDDD